MFLNEDLNNSHSLTLEKHAKRI